MIAKFTFTLRDQSPPYQLGAPRFMVQPYQSFAVVGTTCPIHVCTLFTCGKTPINQLIPDPTSFLIADH